MGFDKLGRHVQISTWPLSCVTRTTEQTRQQLYRLFVNTSQLRPADLISIPNTNPSFHFGPNFLNFLQDFYEM